MKKNFFWLLGIAAFIVVALVPVTIAVARSTGAPNPQQVHIFHSRGHAQLSKAASASPSSTSSNVTYHGGPVMANTANVYAIFWEPPSSTVSANYNSLIERYFGDVRSSPLYKISNQYTQNGGAFPSNAVLAGSLVDTTSAYPESPLLDIDIQNEVTHAQTVKGWASNIDNVFFVFIEQNVTLCYDSSHTACTPDVSSATTKFCAYHSFINTNKSIYAAMPYAASPNFNNGCNTGASPNIDDADQTINVASHEQMEAATDPLLNAWYDSNRNEIGDLCSFTFGPGNLQGADVLWNKNPYIVQMEWSNAIGGCTLTTNTSINSGQPYYQIVNRKSGLVMDVSGGGTNAGAQVIQWTNHSGLNQQWSLVPDGANYQIKNRNSHLVLDVTGGSKNAGANVIQWSPNGGLNQQWFLVPDGGYDLIANVNSLLVADVSGGSTSAGAHVIQWSFNNGFNQQWELVPVSPFVIVNRNSNLVADVSGGSTSAGAHVIQWPSNGGLNQQWKLVSDGAYYQIVNVKSGLVMDVSGGGTNAGAQVIQWTNHNGTNQQWSLAPDGSFFQIVNRNSGLVLDVFGGGKTQGVNVIQWTNHNGLNQQWSLVPTLA